MRGYYFTLIGIIIIYIIFTYLLKKISNHKIERKVQAVVEEYNLKFQFINKKNFEGLIEMKSCYLHVKLFKVNTNNHLIITNATTWIKTKKSEPIKIENQLKGVNSFVKSHFNTDKIVYKLAILYPGVEQIRQYINENEMKIIELNTAINNYRFIKLDDLPEVVNEFIKKTD